MTRRSNYSEMEGKQASAAVGNRVPSTVAGAPEWNYYTLPDGTLIIYDTTEL
jgi:hypothetical protein